MENYCGGYYQVGEDKFPSKLLAFVEGTKQNIRPRWIFFNDVWEKAAKAEPTGLSLQDLYKKRAQQLRDKHDYLILSYSGGSDSWTILNAFLSNGIQLDEVVLNWPVKATQGPNAAYPYTPDFTNRAPANYLSEWDAFLKDDLQAIAAANPKTKVTIMDWSETLLTDPPRPEEVLSKPTFMHYVQMRIMGVKTDSEKDALDKGKSVGYIYGADKPRLFRQPGVPFAYTHFCDGSIRHNVSPETYGTHIEYFYMSPDMPSVAIETARVMMRWFDEGKSPMSIIENISVRENWDTFLDLSAHLCRPDYDFTRFQTDDASNKSIRHDKYTWFENLPDYAVANAEWEKMLAGYFNQIHPDAVEKTPDGVPHSLWCSFTPYISVGEFTRP